MECSLVCADDVTGALEAGALLASCGPALVSLDAPLSEPAAAKATVLLLPVRHAEPSAAQALILDAFSFPHAADASLYWKTDSTLRGPIGACFSALLDRFPERALVYIPAYPALGRTVRDGILRVGGTPVSETEFARDSLNPVRTSHVPGLLRESCRHPVWHASTPEELQPLLAPAAARVIVCDAWTEDGVAALVAACGHPAPRLILAGPAGGIRYWARGRAAVSLPPPTLPPAGPWLVVCGSRHPASRVQAEAARGLGLTVLLSAGETAPSALAEAGRLAALAAQSPSRAMMVFGGDTALALFRALGIRTLEPLGEILPGVAVSRSGDRLFVTKAGGFGPPDLVARVQEKWNS